MGGPIGKRNTWLGERAYGIDKEREKSKRRSRWQKGSIVIKERRVKMKKRKLREKHRALNTL